MCQNSRCREILNTLRQELLNRFCTDIAYFSLHCLISESTSILCSQGGNCDRLLFQFAVYRVLYVMHITAAALQQPGSLGHPRKSFGLLHFCSSSQNITCWAPNLLAFAILGSLKYLLGNSLDNIYIIHPCKSIAFFTVTFVHLHYNKI